MVYDDTEVSALVNEYPFRPKGIEHGGENVIVGVKRHYAPEAPSKPKPDRQKEQGFSVAAKCLFDSM